MKFSNYWDGAEIPVTVLGNIMICRPPSSPGITVHYLQIDMFRRQRMRLGTNII
jgi:hypothetical protein